MRLGNSTPKVRSFEWYSIVVVLILLVAITSFLIYSQWHSPWLFHLGIQLGWNKRGQEMIVMNNLRAIGFALDAYAKDHGGLLPEPPVPSETFRPYSQSQIDAGSLPRLMYPWPKHPNRTAVLLKKILEPRYIKGIPTHDYWGNPLYFDISKDRKHYIVLSLGENGQPDPDIIYYWDPRETNRDIIHYDGFFISAPDDVTH